MYSNDETIDQLMPQLELHAGKDEEKFEEVRAAILRAAIDGYPEEYRQRAAGLQFALEAELGLHKDPVSRMNRMIELFWEKVDEFNVALKTPSAYTDLRESKRTRAKVIPLFGTDAKRQAADRAEA